MGWEGASAELSLQLRRPLTSVQCPEKEHPRSNRCKASVLASEAGMNLASPKRRKRLKCEREGKSQAGARLSPELRMDKELGFISVASSGVWKHKYQALICQDGPESWEGQQGQRLKPHLRAGPPQAPLPRKSLTRLH